ncbi:hypothetical protein GCM10027167_11170 [Nocardia heshunensis]
MSILQLTLGGAGRCPWAQSHAFVQASARVYAIARCYRNEVTIRRAAEAESGCVSVALGRCFLVAGGVQAGEGDGGQDDHDHQE